MIWTVVASGMATLQEVEETWSLDDVARALAFLSLRAWSEAKAIEDARKAAERGA